MKKILGMILLGMFAYANNDYYEAYKEASQLSDDALSKFVKDENYKTGIKYITDNKFFESKKVNKADVETEKGIVKFEEIFIPDYNKALNFFNQSAEKSNNPISSYIGSYIIQNYTNLQNPEYLKMFVEFSKIMYNQEVKICQAYLNFGSIFENGYFEKKDENKAIEIYELGLKDDKCKKGWISSVLNSKILSLKMSKK